MRRRTAALRNTLDSESSELWLEIASRLVETPVKFALLRAWVDCASQLVVTYFLSLSHSGILLYPASR